MCKQITPLMLYEVTSRLVILKFSDAPIQVANFIIITVIFKLTNFTFCSQIISITSHIVQIVCINLVSILQPLQFSLFPLIYKF
jgi:hypothetical protein